MAYNMFDDQVYPITDENNFISDDGVIPEPNIHPVFTPDGLDDNLSFEEQLLSISDNMFEQQQSPSVMSPEVRIQDK